MRSVFRHSPNDSRVLACQLAISRAGGLTELGRIFGVTPQAIYKWEIVPIEHCRRVARLSGIPVHVLRPDVFDEKSGRRRTEKLASATR